MSNTDFGNLKEELLKREKTIKRAERLLWIAVGILAFQIAEFDAALPKICYGSAYGGYYTVHYMHAMAF
jgi:hypothetical protein